MVLRVRARHAAGCVLMALCLGSLPFSWSTHAAQQSAPTSPVATQKALLDRYCLTCHTQRLKERGTVPIALDSLDLSQVGANAATWEKVVVKMRAGLMPPAGSPRPDKATHDAFASWLESELDRNGAAHPNPGRTEPFHRLNRAEYRNAIRDILDLDVDVAALLPADDVSYGFDNIAGVLKMSPTLLERYLAAAQKVSRLAVGTPLPAPNIDYFRVTDDLSQDAHLPGLPLGTRGGTLIRYVFPMDGEYEIRPRLTRDLNESVPLYTEDQRLEISIDGERVGLYTLPGIGGAADTPPESPGPPPDANAPRTPGPGTPDPGAQTARASGDLPDSTDCARGCTRKSRAQSSRRVVEPARAREGWRARSRRDVHQQRLGDRRNAAPPVRAAVPRGRQYPGDASRCVPAQR